MISPTMRQEEKLRKQGYQLIAGLDEAGRGPLAGPVVAAFVIVNNSKLPAIPGVRNSKALSKHQRQDAYEAITKHPDIAWGVGIVSEQVIDEVNILEATKLAMLLALKSVQADFLLIDGNFAISTDIPQQSIIKGDETVFSIAAASIIAKVTRDRLMEAYHTQYPAYGFDQHKGYGTKQHLTQLLALGPCQIHRKTFYPVSSLLGVTSRK